MFTSGGEPPAIFQNLSFDIQGKQIDANKRPQALDQVISGRATSAAWVGTRLTDKSKPTAKHALTILINISSDQEVLRDIVNDDAFLESLLLRITVCLLI